MGGVKAGRGGSKGARAWLLAVPLLAAVGAVFWVLLGSTIFGPSAGAGGDGPGGDGDQAPEAADLGGDATLTATNRAPPKPAMKEEEEPAKPTFTKAEGIFGRVIDSREQPIPGAKVSLFSPDPSNPWGGQDGAPVATTAAAADGTYLLGPAPPGRLKVRAEAPTYASTTAFAASRGAKVDLILDRSGSLKVKVRNRKGEAVKDAEVRVQSGFASTTTKTSESGEALVDGLASGPSTVRVTALGYGPLNLSDVQVEPGKVSERSVVMGKGVPVSGRVVDDATNAPVEGVEVSAKVQWDQTALRSDTVKTDADGRFKLESAGGQGEWVEVKAKKEGFADGAAGVQLQAGANAGGQEVEVRLGKGVQAKGVVLDADNRAAAGAKVMWVGVGWGTPAAALTATADADGNFALDLPAGTGKEWWYTIAATAPGKGIGAGTSTQNQPRGATIRLTGVGSVSGKVTTPGGEGLEGAAVTLSYDWNSKAPPAIGTDVQPWMYQQLFWDPRVMNLAATTDATGSFRIDDVPAASYRVQAAWGLDRGAASETVSLRAGGTETVKLEIGNGNTIEGKVLGLEDKPVFGAYVNGWDPQNNRQGENRSAFARTDAEGRFILRGVLGDRWTLNVSAAGFAYKQVPAVQNGDKTVEIKLTPLGWITGVVTADNQPFQGAFTVQLQPSGPRREDGNRMRGGPGGMYWDGGNGREETFTSADGTFTMRGVGSGAWKVNVTTQDNWIPGAVPEITVTDGRGTDGVEVRLVRGAVFVGAVLEDGTRAPIANASVNLRIRGPAQSGGLTWSWSQTDVKGQFSAQGLATGTYVVAVNTPAGFSWEEEIRLEAGQTTQKDLLSQRWGTLRVRLVDAAGAPIAGAQVNLQTERGTWVQPNWDALRKEGLVDFNKPNAWESVTQTDANGVNVRTHVSPGRVQVNVWMRNGKGNPPVTWAVIASDQVTDVTITLPAAEGAETPK